MPSLPVAGTALQYHEVGQGPVLLLLHGLGGSHLDWEQQWPHFAARYRVIAPDLRGFGDTPRGARLLTIARLAEDLRTLLDTLGIARCVVVGHSMGGAVAQELSLREPTRIAALVITNSLPSFRPRRWPHVAEIAFRWLVMATLGPARLSARIAARLYPRPEQAALRERAIARGARNSRLSYLMALSALALWSALARLPSLRMPLLVFEAEFDYFAHEDIQRFRALRPDAEWQYIDGAHHALPSEFPQRFNAALDDFLRRHWPAQRDEAAA